MKQIKRRRNNIIHDNNYNKRKKIDGKKLYLFFFFNEHIFYFLVTANETNWFVYYKTISLFYQNLSLSLFFFSFIKENITNLENLSNELIYEIFEFLNYHHVFQAFYDINQRFQDLLLN